MPTPEDIARLTSLVLLATFALSALLGAIVHRTNFCTMGAISDALNMGHWDRMRQWALAAGVAMIGFGALAAWGAIRAQDAVYASPRWMWLSAMVGGLLFGFGMVLASGCGSKLLVRMGAGSLKAFVAFLAMAISSYATLRGITAVWRDSTVDRVFTEFDGSANVGNLLGTGLGWSPPMALLICGAVLGLALIGWALYRRDFWRGRNLLAGFGVGSIIVAMWWVSGHLGYVAEHPATLEPAYLASRTGRMEALTFTSPMAYTIDWLMFFSDANQRLSIAVVSVFGVLVGAAAHALFTRRFRWDGFKTTEDLANHLIGGTLMGIGGVTALGCTIGQGLSGISTLSLTSFTAVASIIAGAVLALKYQYWRLSRDV